MIVEKFKALQKSYTIKKKRGKLDENGRGANVAVELRVFAALKNDESRNQSKETRCIKSKVIRCKKNRIPVREITV